MFTLCYYQPNFADNTKFMFIRYSKDAIGMMGGVPLFCNKKKYHDEMINCMFV